eukprot:1180051-Prorocentrum_minimum.AAC.1
MAAGNSADPIGDSLEHCATASQHFQPQQIPNVKHLARTSDIGKSSNLVRVHLANINGWTTEDFSPVNVMWRQSKCDTIIYIPLGGWVRPSPLPSPHHRADPLADSLSKGEGWGAPSQHQPPPRPGSTPPEGRAGGRKQDKPCKSVPARPEVED